MSVCYLVLTVKICIVAVISVLFPCLKFLMAKMELKLVSKEAYEFYKTSIEAIIAERRDEPAVCIFRTNFELSNHKVPETRSAGKENNYTWDLVKEKGKPTQNESQEIKNVSPPQNVPYTNCNELTDQCFTLTWIWLVGCFGVKRPFETVFQSVSGRLPESGWKRREMIDERKNVQTTPTRTQWKRSRPLPYYYPNK